MSSGSRTSMRTARHLPSRFQRVAVLVAQGGIDAVSENDNRLSAAVFVRKFVESKIERFVKLCLAPAVRDVDRIKDRAAVGREIVSQVYLVVKLDNRDSV